MGETITMSLVSHTNVGKTTLARTLLRREVGEVRDRAHVTDVSEAHELVTTGEHRLLLWDTPGFGDLTRLVARLRHEGRGLGWLLRQVWDRVVDRPLWCSQEAARNVQREADVVLYLVNAAEDPEFAGYVRPELELLTWLDRPVLLLLNQVGDEREDSERAWRALAEDWPIVRDVIPLDAFTRCWVEESVVLHRAVELLDEPQRGAMIELVEAWQAHGVGVYRSSMRALAAYVASTAVDVERPAAGRESGDGGMGTFSRVVDALRFSAVDSRGAMTRLNERLDRATRALMKGLLETHQLDGESAPKIEQRIQDYQVRHGSLIDGRSGAVAGAVVSGALGGLAADALSGGLSLGGGMIAGGILGALGGSALARGYRWIGGDDSPSVGWTPEFLDRLVRQALLRYLAVAHFGRGRGRFAEFEHPDHWGPAVDAALEPHRAEIARAWRTAEKQGPESVTQITDRLERVVDDAMRRVLRDAYPRAADRVL